jgi:hypothetical protein
MGNSGGGGGEGGSDVRDSSGCSGGWFVSYDHEGRDGHDGSGNKNSLIE